VGKKTSDVIALPDSHGGVPADRSLESDVSVSRVILLGETLFHREALARALHECDDIALIDSVADVHAALILAEERHADVLLVDSPSDAVARALAARPVGCKLVFIGAVGARCRQWARRGAAILVGVSSSLEEVHVALRFANPRQAALRSPAADSVLSEREQEVSRLVAGGYANKQIADACNISIATVKNHVHHILGKLHVQRRAQIAGLARDPSLAVTRKQSKTID
jgi:two-component system nitrate/nitrite response regulator NarL